jgi:hypothetical protein
MSIAVPPSHDRNAEVSGPFNAPGTVSRRNSTCRARSTLQVTFVLVKTFAGGIIGGVLGAMMFSAAGLPFGWVGLISGAALGATYAIGDYPHP